ncbi:MAG: ATP-binding protein [Planctomycetales bacterium]|nr:ATP-binding protein [Planctomycetales bacterium]
MGLRARLVIPVAGASAAALTLGGWLALRLAERAEARAAEAEVRLIAGFAAHLDVPLNAEALRRLAEAAGVQCAALAEDGEPLAHTFGAGAEPDLAALRRLVSPAAEASGLPAVRVEGKLYRAALAATKSAPPLRGPGLSGPRPAWLAVLVPESRISEAGAAVFRPVLLVAVLGAVAVALLASLLLLPSVRRVRRLAAAARAVAGGDLSADVPVSGRDEVSALGESFRTMLAAVRDGRERAVAAEKLAALGQLAAAVAHEIRNPLAAIRMTTEMLRRDSSPEGRESLDLLVREASRLELFLDDLLSFARPDPGRRENVDLAGIVSDVLDLEGPRLDHLGVSVRREGPAAGAAGPRVSGDPRRLTQVVLNLVLNAAEAAGPGGRVAVRLSEAPAGAALEVRDSGPGVPEPVRDRLFSPFVTTKPNGTGLGLALSRRIAREHGGDLAYVREGGETVFRLTLPAAREPARVPVPS